MRVAQGRNIRFVLEVQVIDKETNRHEITIRKTIGNLLHIRRNRLRGLVSFRDGINQVLHRHGGNKLITGKDLLMPFAIAINNRSDLSFVRFVNLHNFSMLNNMRAKLFIMLSDGFPQLAWTELRIPELFNQ